MRTSDLQWLPPDIEAGVNVAIRKATKAGSNVHLTQVEHDALLNLARQQLPADAPPEAWLNGPLLLLGKPVTIIEGDR